jgi:hypothetical protein
VSDQRQELEEEECWVATVLVPAQRSYLRPIVYRPTVMATGEEHARDKVRALYPPGSEVQRVFLLHPVGWHT